VSRNHRRIPARELAAIRRAVLERDGYRCVQCGGPGALEVDHVVRIEDGGAPLDMANMQTLCRAHHLEKTARENTSPMRRPWREYVRSLMR